VSSEVSFLVPDTHNDEKNYKITFGTSKPAIQLIYGLNVFYYHCLLLFVTIHN
jgi:hypothetical protein